MPRGKKKNLTGQSPVSRLEIEQSILVVRGQRVLLDSALARLYGVSTGALNQAVRRNQSRFPDDFAFQLTAAEVAGMQSEAAPSAWGGRRNRPWVFTEHGVAMLSSVLLLSGRGSGECRNHACICPSAAPSGDPRGTRRTNCPPRRNGSTSRRADPGNYRRSAPDDGCTSAAGNGLSYHLSPHSFRCRCSLIDSRLETTDCDFKRQLQDSSLGLALMLSHSPCDHAHAGQSAP